MSTFYRTASVVLFCLVFRCGALAQSLPTATRLSLDASAGFTSIRANQGPGQCGCFFMNGGSGEIALRNSRNTSFVLNFGRTSIDDYNGVRQGLTLYTVMEGARYHLGRNSNLSPFGEVLVGASHTASNQEYYKSTNAAALLFGGGLDVRLGNSISLRPVEGDWLFTAHKNGQNNIQNQLRLTAGIVFHIHRAAWDDGR